MLNDISALGGVQGVVVCDTEGGLVESVDEADAESVAAVIGFSANQLESLGEMLGLAELEGFAVDSKGISTVVRAVHPGWVAVKVEARRAGSDFTERLDAAVGNEAP